MVANFITETLNTKHPKDEQQPQNTHDNGFFTYLFQECLQYTIHRFFQIIHNHVQIFTFIMRQY